MKAFRHLGNPDFLFGAGSLGSLPGKMNAFVESDANTEPEVFVVTGRHFTGTAAWEELQHAFRSHGFRWKHEFVSGEPSPEVVDALAEECRGSSCVLGIGGGSVLDAGKAAAAMTCNEGSVVHYLEGVGTRDPEGRTLPFIAVPTTAGTGSEATRNAVVSRQGEDGFKKSLRHDAFIPALAVLDPQLAVGCPPEVTRACGLDAFCQLLEAFTSTGATPITDSLALGGLKQHAEGFRLLDENLLGGADEVEFRSRLGLAAYASGLVLANAGLGTVHGIAGPLGAFCHVPHGTACGLLLEPVFQLIARKAFEQGHSSLIEKLTLVGKILHPESGSGQELINRLLDTCRQRAGPLPRLSSYGFTRKDIPAVTAVSGNKNSPIHLSPEEMEQIIDGIF